jgi:hypothetical protein
MITTNKKILNFATVEKGLKTDNFLKFIKKIHRSDKENKYTYLIDNASIHRTKKFMKYARENKLHILYNVHLKNKVFEMRPLGDLIILKQIQ